MSLDLNSMMSQMDSAMADPKAFEDKTSSYEKDERLYKISKDSDGNGSVKLRFIPFINEKENSLGTFVKVLKHTPTIYQGKEKRFITEVCPKTADKNASCPICDFTWDNYNEFKSSDLEKAKSFPRKYASKEKYYSNIVILEDKVNPDNEGKTFIFEYGAQIHKLIQKQMQPSEEEISDKGLSPFNGWNPKSGRDFRLKLKSSKFTDNGFPSWEESFFATKTTELADAEAVIKAAYDLTEFTSMENMPSVEKLQKSLDYVRWVDGSKKKGDNKSVEADLAKVEEVSKPTETSVEEIKQTPKDESSTGSEIDDFFSQF